MFGSSKHQKPVDVENIWKHAIKQEQWLYVDSNVKCLTT